MKKKNIVVWIFVIVMSGLLIWFGMYAVNATKEDEMNNTKQEQNNEKQKINQQTKKENKENKTNDNEDEVYGYLTDAENIIELRKSGNANVLVSTYSSKRNIQDEHIEHNKLFYTIHDFDKESDEVYYIDLNSKSKTSVLIYKANKGDKLSNVTFIDFDGKYVIFAEEEKTDESVAYKIGKYSLKTKNVEFISQTVSVDKTFLSPSIHYAFILNNVIYLKLYGHRDSYNYYNQSYNFYKIGVDGSNLLQIGEEEYNDAIKTVGYIETHPNDDKYLFYNNKKILLSEDKKQILYGDDVIYTATKKEIRFYKVSF